MATKPAKSTMSHDEFVKRLRDIGNTGYGAGEVSRPLHEALGIKELDTDSMKALMIRLVVKFIDKGYDRDIILMTFRLLKGYTSDDRRERFILDSGYMNEKELADYDKSVNDAERKKVLRDSSNRLNKKERTIVERLALGISGTEDLSVYIENLPDLVLPIPSFKASDETAIAESAHDALKISAEPVQETTSDGETPVAQKESIWRRVSRAKAIGVVLAAVFAVSLIIIIATQSNSNDMPVPPGDSAITHDSGDLPDNNVNDEFDREQESETNSISFYNEQGFVQASEYSMLGIENCLWLDEIKVERGKQYIIRVGVHNYADGSSGLTAENVALQLSASQRPGVFDRSISIISSIVHSDADAPTENTVSFYGDEPFSLEFVEGTGKYSSGGMSSLDERGVSVSDDVFLQDRGALLGYSELNGRIPAGEQYAGYFTILVRPRFETKLPYGFGPERETFTALSPPPYVTLNSVTDNPEYGDERVFVKIKNANESDRTYTSAISLVPGQEYEVLIHYDNNASRPTVTDETNFAEGVRLSAFFPALINGNDEAEAGVVISSENAQPQTIWSNIVLVNDTGGDILVRYVQDSASINNSGRANGTILDAGMLFSAEGVLLGHDELDGIIPSAVSDKVFFGGYVTFRIVADQPNLKVRTLFRNALDADWSESVEARAGDVIQCLIEYENTGTIQQDNVVLKVELPIGVHYIENSSRLRTSRYPNLPIADGVATYDGVNVGNYAPNASVLYWFDVSIDLDVVAQNGSIRLESRAHAITANGSRSSRARIEIVQ